MEAGAARTRRVEVATFISGPGDAEVGVGGRATHWCDRLSRCLAGPHNWLSWGDVHRASSGRRPFGRSLRPALGLKTPDRTPAHTHARTTDLGEGGYILLGMQASTWLVARGEEDAGSRENRRGYEGETTRGRDDAERRRRTFQEDERRPPRRGSEKRTPLCGVLYGMARCQPPPCLLSAVHRLPSTRPLGHSIPPSAARTLVSTLTCPAQKV